MKRRVPVRQIQQQRLAAQRARARERRVVRWLKWSALLVLFAGIVAAVTYGVFFAPYTALRNMLPVPKRLISVVLVVNEAERTVPDQGTLVVHPTDVVKVSDVRTDGRFNWGLRLHSDQFSANQLLEGRQKIKEFWPHFEYEKPLKVGVEVMAGSRSIGRFHMVVQLRARDWVNKAQEAGSPEKKVEYYERAASLEPENALIMTSLAQLYGEQGRWAEAAATYEKVAASSKTVPMLQKLVEACQKADQIDKALEVYLDLMQVSGADKEPFYGFISYLNAKRPPAEAAAFLAAHLDAFPQSYRPEVQAYLGSLYGQQEQWRLAIQAYKRAITGGVNNPVVNLNLGEAYSRIGRYQQAEDNLLAYLKEKPGDVDAKLRLAAVYRKRKKSKEAIRTLKEVVKEHPRLLKAHLALVDIYEGLHMDKQAAGAYEEIAELAPENKVVHYNLGVLYFEMKDYDQAARAFSKVIKLDSREIDAREYLLETHRRRKKPRQAVTVLEELIRLRPNHWAYYPQAFEFYDELKAYERMTRTLVQAVNKVPDRPELRSLLGIAYEKRDMLEEAVQQFQQARKLAPKNKGYLNHLAVLYERIGKEEEALTTYGEVLALDPDDAEAEENYLRLKLRQIARER
jgi:tetratricopeptide (TPR) repeat protein